MYIILLGSNSFKTSIVFLSNPFLGGSTNTTSGFIFSFSIILGKTSSTSPAKNSILLILFILAFSFASSIACLTISIPYTFLKCFDANIPIVPIPQYKSKAILFCGRPSPAPTYFIAVLYNISV